MATKKDYNTALIFDIGLLVFTSLFSFTLFHDTAKVSSKIATNFQTIMGLAFIFILQTIFPIFMGKIKEQYHPYFEMRFGDFVEKTMNFFFGLILFFVFVMGLGFTSYLKYKNDPINITVLIFGTIFALTFGGLLSQRLYFNDKDEKLTLKQMAWIWSWYVVVLNLFVSIVVGITLHGSVYWVLLYVIGFSLGALYLTFKIIKWLNYLIVEKKKELWLENARIFVLNLATIFILSYWLEMISISMMSKPSINFCGSIFILTITGYLPFRIFIELRPPFSVFSFLSGLGAIGIFIFRLIK